MRSAENAFAVQLFRDLPERYDLLAEVLSFGQNARWRREVVRRIGRVNPRRVLDVATGTGGVAIAIAKQTGANVIGIDVSAEMLEIGRRRIHAAGLDDRIELEIGRAEHIPFDSASFDAVSFTYVLRYVADPAATIAELARALRPGGVMASLDFLEPDDPLWHGAWWVYTRVVLPVAGFVLGGRAWWRVGRFLGPSISSHYGRMPVQTIVKAWRAAGMVDVECRVMSLGGGLVMWGAKGVA